MTQTGRERRPAPLSPPVRPCFGDGVNSPRDGLGRVRELLAQEAPVVVILSGEYPVGLHPLTLAEATRRLEALGFTTVETTVLGEEMIAAAYEQQFGRERSGVPSLRSTCPVAVDWVRHRHPALTQALVALVPPYVAQARLVLEIHAADVRIVYVAPCRARKDEAHDPTFAAGVDVAIGFDELRVLLDEAPESDHPPVRLRRPRAIKQLSAIDGFPVHTLRESNLTERDVVTVRGVAQIEELLSAIARGETCPPIVDMLACEGCIDGPCVNNDLSLFAKRNIASAEQTGATPPVVDSRTFLSAIPVVEIWRTFRPDPAPRREVAEPGGPPRGDGPELRLAEEVARATRYGVALSVLMIELDGIEDVTSRHGHDAGDACMHGVEALLATRVRDSDTVLRYRDDRFLLILPNTGKTDAWAFAEQARVSIASLSTEAVDGPRISTGASLGVASLGACVATAPDLIAAADAALQRAKLTGGDRVELAAG